MFVLDQFESYKYLCEVYSIGQTMV